MNAAPAPCSMHIKTHDHPLRSFPPIYWQAEAVGLCYQTAEGTRQLWSMYLSIAMLDPMLQVFSREELEAIASLCIKHDVIAICDEVYVSSNQ